MDLIGATFNLLVLNQVYYRVLKKFCSCIVAVGMLLCVGVSMKFSAHDIMLMLAGGKKVSCMYISLSVGDRTDH